MKQKIVGIVLLFSLLAPAIGTYTFLVYHKKQIRKEVKRKIIADLDKNELVVLKFTVHELKIKLHWKHQYEFRFNGEMYDVVHRQVSGDTVIYWCWWDQDETQLGKYFRKTLAVAMGNDVQQKEKKCQLTNFYKSLFFEQSAIYKIIVAELKTHLTGYSCYYYKLSYPPPLPPPRWV